MKKLFDEMNLEQRMAYIYSDNEGAGYKWPEIEQDISECMNFEFTTFDCKEFFVICVRDLEENTITQIEAFDIQKKPFIYPDILKNTAFSLN